MYHSIENLLELASKENKNIWEVVLESDAREKSVSGDEVFERMRTMYRAMKEADGAYDAESKSASQMAGGDGAKMREYNESGKNIAGDYLSRVMEKAIMMGESNACMKRIVAAPTAGACGVIPAVFIAYEELYGIKEDRMIEALLVAAGVGAVIAENASISGARGGCQAEIGSAAAMASAGLTYLQGGTMGQIANAVALTLKSILGLTCDPVCGLVEVPCIKRNSSGAVLAVNGAQLAMAGIESRIPADEVIEAMRTIGEAMPASLKETGGGGLAVTETAKSIKTAL